MIRDWKFAACNTKARLHHSSNRRSLSVNSRRRTYEGRLSTAKLNNSSSSPGSYTTSSNYHNTTGLPSNRHVLLVMDRKSKNNRHHYVERSHADEMVQSPNYETAEDASTDNYYELASTINRNNKNKVKKNMKNNKQLFYEI